MPADPTQRRPASLALRVTVFVGIVTTLVFLAFGWIIERSIEYHFAEQDADELRVVAQAVQQSLLSLPSGGNNLTFGRRLASAVAGHHGVFFHVADSRGRLLYATPGPDLTAIARTVAPVRRIDASSLHVWQYQQKTYRGAVMRFSAGEHASANPFTVIVATTMDFHLHYLDEFQRMLWIATMAACVIAILAAWLAVHQGHAPLRNISSKIRGITSDQLHVRLTPEAVPIELAELAASFNDMLGRIEDGFRRLSNFSADIAHELRTPVTNLTTQTQVALTKARSVEQYREILYSSLEEYERMAKMIGDMLFLAQTDNGLLRPDSTAVNIAAEVRALFDYFEVWAEEHEVSLKLEGNAPPVRGDRLLLRRALSNLLSNAIRYTPPGQAVTVTLAANADAVIIRVENPGAEISSEHLPRLFDRFYRVDPSRQRKGDGAGLGLAIVQSIIDAHDGVITAASANGRTTFVITLPKLAGIAD
ncbi:MAG: Cu(+)/Ag(+) sensor histidine kinase [Burkholderiales bacterium]